MIDVQTVDVIRDSLRAAIVDVPLREDTIDEYAEKIDRDLADLADARRAWSLLRDAMELVGPPLASQLEAMSDEILVEYRFDIDAPEVDAP